MKHLRITGTHYLWGKVPDHIVKSLCEAIVSVREDVFFCHGQPRKKEICEVDAGIHEFLSKKGWMLKREFSPFDACDFKIDIACLDHKVLIEIEKGTSPRLELDTLKIASACLQFPERWKYGALVVPSRHIKLRLVDRKTPWAYLKTHYTSLVSPILEACNVSGFVVVGYEDPRP
jgi:hypothetical protein